MYESALKPEIYTVAWIAPLQVEAEAARCMLDKEHAGPFPWSRDNNYIYAAGEVCGHHVIIATLHNGVSSCTISSAAALTSHIRMIFSNLWFSLLIGVATGLPDVSANPPRDIRLGDVLVALPEGEDPAVVPYGLGKETDDEGFRLLRSGHVLLTTEAIVRSAIGNIRLEWPNDEGCFLPYYTAMVEGMPENQVFKVPEYTQDNVRLSTGYIDSQSRRRPCVNRRRVWYGSIGSGDRVTHSARERDDLQKQYNLIGLENAAAGVMKYLRAGVIMGVCDYGDDHDYQIWRPHAAAMAAAYAKSILDRIQPLIVTTIAYPAQSKFSYPTAVRGQSHQLDGRESSSEQVAETRSSGAEAEYYQTRRPFERSGPSSIAPSLNDYDSRDIYNFIRSVVQELMSDHDVLDASLISARCLSNAQLARSRDKGNPEWPSSCPFSLKVLGLSRTVAQIVAEVRLLWNASMGSNFLGQPRQMVSDV